MPAQHTISVIIATYNRPEDLHRCLCSLLQNTMKPTEIIVVDQSKNSQSKKVIRHINNKSIRYIKIKRVSKAHALNIAIKHAKSDILSFTDDDSIVSKQWLEKLHHSFKSHPDIAGVFGNVYPFVPTRKKQLRCPATFYKKKTHLHASIGLPHYHAVGLGNNMSLRKQLFNTVGRFKPWLGPGNRFQAGGEDSDMIFRILLFGYKLETNPSVVVYHNRWITPNQERLLQARYTCGLIAFETYHLFGSYRDIARRYIKMRIQERSREYIKTIGKKINIVESCKYIVIEIAAVIIGAYIGIIHRNETS